MLRASIVVCLSCTSGSCAQAFCLSPQVKPPSCGPATDPDFFPFYEATNRSAADDTTCSLDYLQHIFLIIYPMLSSSRHIFFSTVSVGGCLPQLHPTHRQYCQYPHTLRTGTDQHDMHNVCTYYIHAAHCHPYQGIMYSALPLLGSYCLTTDPNLLFCEPFLPKSKLSEDPSLASAPSLENKTQVQHRITDLPLSAFGPQHQCNTFWGHCFTSIPPDDTDTIMSLRRHYSLQTTHCQQRCTPPTITTFLGLF